MSQPDTREFRGAIGLFATGVTVITAQAGGVAHGMTANSVTSVSLDPLLLLVCIDRRARMCNIIHEAGRFAVNILGERQEAISRHFAGRPNDQLNVTFADLAGVPTLPGALAAIACTVERELDGGDHIIVIGKVDAFIRTNDVEPPLLYFAGRYRQVSPEPTDDSTKPYMDFFYHNLIPFE
jgi:flavin reductase (DIM6/NTAB) family NADH-FMN oxidoreductase RutF